MSVSDYYSDNETISHISFTESDLEDRPDLDNSFDSSNEYSDQEDELVTRINNWLIDTDTHEREQTLEETYTELIHNILNYSIQFDITNLNLVSFDLLNSFSIEELETYRENILIRSESIPVTLYNMINIHLVYVNNKINQIINAEFHN
jgi:hypothetical protein